MLALLLSLFRMVWLFGKGHRGVVLEKSCIRQQLSIYQRKQKRSRLTRGRPLVVDNGLGDVEELAAKLCSSSIPTPVVRWQRERFRQH